MLSSSGPSAQVVDSSAVPENWAGLPPPNGNVADDELLVLIEQGADRILAETGVRFEGDPETLDMWRQHGARVVEDRVYLDGEALRAIIRSSAPPRVTLRGRNPQRDVTIGDGERPVFAPVYGPPNVLLRDGQRQPGSLAHYTELVRLAHEASALTCTGHMLCVMNDVPEAARPLEMAWAHLAHSDKPFMGTVASPTAARDVISLVSKAVGRAAQAGSCNLLHLINSTPPLTFKENPLKCLRTIARCGEGAMVTSYMMMGATSPVTVSGALMQGYAEVMAGLALAQLWSPGAPVVMGIYALPFSMRSMLPVFGDPVAHMVQMFSVRLARRLGVPARGDGGVTSAKVDDGQAGYEGASANAAAILSGADFVLHSAGWLELGRCTSFSKFERDAAMIGAMLGLGAAVQASPLMLDPALQREFQALLPP
ncbi:MAG: trimethylamine methyltransferase family protein [Aestuariivirga sp.]|nr:trimethylamine methyltransferase family protein [Aestuariivirga sp.]